MFKDNVLELAVTMFVNDLQCSVGYAFTHKHSYVKDNYTVLLESHTVIDPSNGLFSPIFSLHFGCDDYERASVIRMSNKTFFSINGIIGHARQMNPLEQDFEEQLIEQGYNNREIELIKSLQFSINMYMNKQQ